MMASHPPDAFGAATSQIYSGNPFLIYRLPGDRMPRFHPFDPDTCRFKGAVVEPFLPGDSHPGDAVPDATNQEDYLAGFENLKAAMRTGGLKKAILSRVINLTKPRDFAPLSYFRSLADNYPNAMVYLLRHPRFGMWTGATPEVLLRKRGGWWHTVSLAGTRPHNPEGKYQWGKKEREEQEFVSEHIRRVLAEFSARDVEETGPQTVVAGSVAHLKSDFRFRMEEESATAPALLAALHPTPAVGGVPLPAALGAISAAENHSRELYTGYLGQFALPESVDVYVNLRCMKIGVDRLGLYSGGGITAGSEAESEWIETGEKAKTLLRLLPEYKDH